MQKIEMTYIAVLIFLIGLLIGFLFAEITANADRKAGANCDEHLLIYEETKPYRWQKPYGWGDKNEKK